MAEEWREWEFVQDSSDFRNKDVTLWRRFRNPSKTEDEWCICHAGEEPHNRQFRTVYVLASLAAVHGVSINPAIALRGIKSMVEEELRAGHEGAVIARCNNYMMQLCEAGLGGRGLVQDFDLFDATREEAAVRAIAARIQGEWDCPPLVAFGPLMVDAEADIMAICDGTLEGDLDLSSKASTFRL